MTKKQQTESILRDCANDLEKALERSYKLINNISDKEQQEFLERVHGIRTIISEVRNIIPKEE